MTRCKHCNKLTHSQDLHVYFDIDDYDKISELQELEKWTPAYNYKISSPHEVGKLVCGDIIIHFISKKKGE